MIFENGLNDLYFEWITSLVFPDQNVKSSYIRLLEELNNIQFNYTNPFDENRDTDGRDLRTHFAYRANISSDIINENVTTNEHCSVLEMMIALSFKIENELMSDSSIGDRTAVWFMLMLDNLGLSYYTDQHWIYGVSDLEVQNIIQRFLNRDIHPNGNGGLFVLKRPYEDMRNVDIWTQANWYISETYIK